MYKYILIFFLLITNSFLSQNDKYYLVKKSNEYTSFDIKDFDLNVVKFNPNINSSICDSINEFRSSNGLKTISNIDYKILFNRQYDICLELRNKYSGNFLLIESGKVIEVIPFDKNIFLKKGIKTIEIYIYEIYLTDGRKFKELNFILNFRLRKVKYLFREAI